MSYAAIALVNLIGGILVGLLWREAYEIIRGRHWPMDTVKRQGGPLLMVALIVSILFSAGVGISVMINDAGDRATERCNVKFNQLEADAREARISAGDPASKAELEYVEKDTAYQEALAEILSDEDSMPDLTRLAVVVRERAVAARTYKDALEKSVEIRDENPYPPANYCAEGGPGR